MLSSAALRARVASIIDALSRTAVAEIAKVVEEGMMVLRLEICEQENEINKLKSNVELLHVELSAARVKLRAGHHGTSGSSAGDARTLLIDQERSHLSGPEFQLKVEPVDETREESSGRADPPEGRPGQWRSAPQSEPQCTNSVNVGENSPSRLDTAEGLQPGPSSHGLLGYSQLRSLYGAVRKSTVKRLVFKKGYICPFCGKCFERGGHLERHKRIHTGEKPYRCDTCGRRFNQKCSLKEHAKIHNRCIEPRLKALHSPVEMPVREEKQILGVRPCSETVSPPKAERLIAGIQDNGTTFVLVKSEPTEESITHALDGNKEAEAVGSSAWTVMSGAEYPGSSGQIGAAPAEASRSSFPGKPYAELRNGIMSQTPYGPSDTFLVSGDSGPHAAAGARSHGVAFEMLKAKKCYVCSYCGKSFERSGHLERHLRIHTGEKPYGCHVCGRCFNQKSSLKGHMKTHNKCDTTDVLGSRRLMLTAPDATAAQAAFDRQPPGSVYSEAAVEQTVLVQVEDYVHQNGISASDRSQLVACGLEQSGTVAGPTVCVLLHDVRCISPANKPQGYGPVPDVMHTDRTQSPNTAVTRLVSQEVEVKAPSPEQDQTREEVASELKPVASGNDKDASGPNYFICSHCRQSFEIFSSFQMHRCKNVAETFTCDICDKVFSHLTMLKLHRKLHAI